jgi:hypothetical protein
MAVLISVIKAWKTLLWSQFPDGPDWVLERGDALARLLEWKQEMLNKMTGHTEAIVTALASNASCAFAGVGRHLANDLCFQAAIHPALPCWYQSGARSSSGEQCRAEDPGRVSKSRQDVQ